MMGALFVRARFAGLSLLAAGGTLLAGLILPGTPAVAAPSFSLEYTADFQNATVDPNVWAVYNNPNNGDDSRISSNVVVHDGMVTLHSRWNASLGEWTHAGMCACNRPDLIQKYGKYEVRMRASASHNRVVALLWPSTGWPPEVDFTKMGGGDGAEGTRQTNTQTLHYSASNQQIHSQYDADMTAWHTVGVEWTPGVIKYTLDGTVTKTISDTTAVPSQTMWLGLQTGYQTGVSHSDHSEDTRFDVDWVKIYDYQP